MTSALSQRPSGSAAAVLIACAITALAGCGSQGSAIKLNSDEEIAKAWRDDDTQREAARTIAEDDAFQGLKLAEVKALIGKPADRLLPNSDAMSKTAGGWFWNERACDGTPQQCRILSLEFINGRVSDAHEIGG